MQSVFSTLFVRWRQRCTLSPSVLWQLVYCQFTAIVIIISDWDVVDAGRPVCCSDVFDGRMQLRWSSYWRMGPANTHHLAEEVLLRWHCWHWQIWLQREWTLLHTTRWQRKLLQWSEKCTGILIFLFVLKLWNLKKYFIFNPHCLSDWLTECLYYNIWQTADEITWTIHKW